MSSNEPATAPEEDSHSTDIDIDFLRSRAESERDRRATELSVRHDNLLKELFQRDSNLGKPEHLLIEWEGGTDEAGFEEFRATYRQSRFVMRFGLEIMVRGSTQQRRLLRYPLIIAKIATGSQYAGDDADGRADPNNTSAHPHKRRPLPPPERMVTRGISAKKLAFSPETPTGPFAPSPSAAQSTGAAGFASTPVTRRRSSTAPKPSPAMLARPVPGSAVNSRSIRQKGRDTKPDPRRRQVPKNPVVAVPEADSELGGYRWYEWQLRVQNNPIGALLPTANKTLTTKDWQAARNEAQQMALLSRVEQLKEKRLWSFRQLKPFVPPCRSKTNWDSLLDEMKWLRVDFRQERRWKLATAYIVAHWVAEWHASDDKASLCVSRSAQPMQVEHPPQVPTENQDPQTNTEETVDLTVDPALSKPAEVCIDDQPSTFMDVTACLYVVDDGSANHVLDIPTYVPPRPDEVFLDENQHKRVVPVSRLLSERRVIDEATRWEGVDENTREPVTPTIQPSDPDAGSHNPLFSHSSKDMARNIPQPQEKEIFFYTRPSLEWSTSEEADLLYLAVTHHYNWTMVRDMLYSRGLGPVRWRRTEWECYRQYEKVAGTRVVHQAPPDPQKGSGPAAGRASASAEPDPRIAQHFVTMDSIRKLSRNKERYKPPGADRKPPTKVVLTTHDTHYQAQTQAGIDPIGPPLTPADLAHMKRARALHAQEQGRQIYGAHQRGGLLIGRPPPTGLPMPLPYNQFRGLAVRPPSLPLQPPGPALPPGSIPMLTPQQQMHPAIRPPATPLMPGQVPQSPSMARMNGAATPMMHEQYLRAAMIARQQMVQQQQQQASTGSTLQQMNDSPGQSSPSPGSIAMQVNNSVASMNARLQMVRQFTQQQQQLQLQPGQPQHTTQQLQQLQALQQQGQRIQLQQMQAQQLAQQVPGLPTQQQQPQLSALPSPRPQQTPLQHRPQPQSSPQRAPVGTIQLSTVGQIQQNLENIAAAQQRAQAFSDAPHTAAAFVALQNAQQVAKMGQMTPEMIQQQRQVQQTKQQARPGSAASSPPVSMASTPRPPVMSTMPPSGSQQPPSQQQQGQQQPGTDPS
ncbi:chromatin modification- protein VID21 [Geranomyces variabilis]|uniref:Chromatin modification- protein VID21 n=1 Tax=Geranomyces variabilis TaxID=109894 RepID=A0AAD5XMD4_9FUNG|nr:chromatin modification- protein VID21 [Geranomyces variabilis]